MLSLDQLTKLLGYSSANGLKTSSEEFKPENRHVYDLVVSACDKSNCILVGLMMFDVAGDLESKHASKVISCVVSATGVDDARALHKYIWNIGSIPFLIVHLPDHLRIYNGYEFSERSDTPLDTCFSSSPEDWASIIDQLSSESIRTGKLWEKSYASELDPKKRIDHRLLENLGKLSQVLRNNSRQPLKAKTAHSLIGKYLYLRYLRDRGILSDQWMTKNNLSIDSVFGCGANLKGLRELVKCLDDRFNGKIFELNLSNECLITDEHVALVAAIFQGDDLKGDVDNIVRQLTFDFYNYNFEYIPVETLSVVYEQFLHAEGEGRAKGAFYTPVNVAEYLLNEVEAVQAISLGMKILDPSCGSGVFLVLAYRRLIEIYRREHKKDLLTPVELRTILLNSIYGVDMDENACNVASFSLILTLLHYVDPPELHRNTKFKFPSLTETQICNADFFDPESAFAQKEQEFDVVIGNPPWLNLSQKDESAQCALEWIKQNKKSMPIKGAQIADAFAFKILNHISKTGLVGFIMPMTSLFNLESTEFRKHLFKATQFEKITNFSNVRKELFEGRVSMPSGSWVYRPADEGIPKKAICHYGPMAVNQLTSLSSSLWSITINEAEISSVSHEDAESGDLQVWKFAQWGSHRDIRAHEQLKHLFPLSLQEFCKKKGWGDKLPVEGAQFRTSKPEFKHLPEYEGVLAFKEKKFNDFKFKGQRFTCPEKSFDMMRYDDCYLRTRGGQAGLNAFKAPHLLISAFWANHFIYSEVDFLIPPRQIGISCPPKDAIYLKALAVYLYSNLVKYIIFFKVPEFGNYGTMNIVTLKGVRQIPIPDFTHEQAEALSKLHIDLVKEEKEKLEFKLANDDLDWQDRRQSKIDRAVSDLFNIPKHIQLLVEDFVQYKLPLDEGTKHSKLLKSTPSSENLQEYGNVLRDELNEFLRDQAVHKITLECSEEFILCKIEILVDEKKTYQPSIIYPKEHQGLLQGLQKLTKSELSPQFYLQKSIKVFEGNEIQFLKPAQAMLWTRSQALNDSDDIISEILGEG